MVCFIPQRGQNACLTKESLVVRRFPDDPRSGFVNVLWHGAFLVNFYGVGRPQYMRFISREVVVSLPASAAIPVRAWAILCQQLRSATSSYFSLCHAQSLRRSRWRSSLWKSKLHHHPDAPPIEAENARMLGFQVCSSITMRRPAWCPANRGPRTMPSLRRLG